MRIICAGNFNNAKHYSTVVDFENLQVKLLPDPFTSRDFCLSKRFRLDDLVWVHTPTDCLRDSIGALAHGETAQLFRLPTAAETVHIRPARGRPVKATTAAPSSRHRQQPPGGGLHALAKRKRISAFC